MAAEGTRKKVFNREYLVWNPDRYTGPNTSILDTVVKPVPAKTQNP